MIAPVQGHTDAAWRCFHKKIYGGNHIYYTPFIRLEKGEFRKHDLKDYCSDLNDGIELVPQVIFKDTLELETLIAGLINVGAKKIDMNIGCPFPLQTAKGRGAGFIRNNDEFSKIPPLLEKYSDITFSVKMRLGYEDPKEWRAVMPILNCMRLHHITIHPRVAKQQYKGELNFDEFNSFLSESENPVIFNGDIKYPEDIERVKNSYPNIAGVMTARGILGRPSLLAEHESGSDWSMERRISTMIQFHKELLNHYESTLCGDTQILSKIKPFWEYAEDEIGRKSWKLIKKASNMAKYHSAVATVG